MGKTYFQPRTAQIGRSSSIVQMNPKSIIKQGNEQGCDGSEINSGVFTSDHTHKFRIESLPPATDQFFFESLIFLRFETTGSSNEPIATS